MKTLLKLVVALVLLAVIAVVALPFIIPVETYKAQITALVKEQTGRDLTIGGKMRASVFPSLGFEAEQVALSNPAGFSEKHMVEVGSMRIEVELAPLLSQRIEFKRFVLEKPVIHLEVNAAGKNNWDFAPAEAAAPVATQPAVGFISAANAAEAAAPAAKGFDALNSIRLGGVDITGGLVTYRDVPAKAAYELKDVNIALAATDLSSPVKLTGNAKWNGQQVDVSGNVKSPAALQAGKESTADFSVKSGDVLQLIFAGKVSPGSAQGKIEFATTSIPKLAGWAGSPMQWKGKTPLAFGFRGPISCRDQRCAMSETDIVLDALKLRGNLGFAFGGAKPVVEARLATELLDINPYLTPEKRADARFSLIADAQAATAWNNEPIDLSALKLLNADVSLMAGAVKFQKIALGKTSLHLVLSSGVLQGTLPEVVLYGGRGKGNFTVNANAVPFTFEKQFSMAGVQAEPFLKDAAEFDRLSGTLALDISVNGRGASQQQIVSSLGGNGRVTFTDGAFKGVNLAQLVRDIKSAVTVKQGEGGSQKTDFAELGGTFTIAGGIVSNKDLAMKAPLIRLKGAGTVDLPRQYVNYRLEPEIVGSLKGQGGKEKEGLGIPVLVEGSFDQLTFRPDFASAAREALQDPEKAKETVRNIKEQIKEGKGSLKELKNNPDAVKDLLKGLR